MPVMNPFIKTRFYRLILLLCLAVATGPAASAQEETADTEKFKNWLGCALVDILFTSYSTNSVFTVRVAFHGTPMPEAAVVLQRTDLPTGAEAVPDLTRKTDSDGTVKFSGVPRGKYAVRVQELLAPTFAEVDVNPDLDTSEEVTFEWPVIKDVVRNVRGTLVSTENVKPLEEVKVELLDFRSARVVGDARTNRNGDYEIDGIGDGIYVLRFTPFGSRGHYDIGIELRGDGFKEQLPSMQLEETDCGINLFSTEAAASHK